MPDLVIDLILEAARETLATAFANDGVGGSNLMTSNLLPSSLVQVRALDEPRHCDSRAISQRLCLRREIRTSWRKPRPRSDPPGLEAMVYALDLREPQSAEIIINGTLERFGRIDALLNIAGAVPQIDLFEMTDAQWDDGMALKLHGARRLTMQCLGCFEGFERLCGVDLRKRCSSIRSPDLRQSRRRTQPSTHSLRHSQSKESKTGYKSTALCQGPS